LIEVEGSMRSSFLVAWLIILGIHHTPIIS
jgi:hypothetical protein